MATKEEIREGIVILKMSMDEQISTRDAAIFWDAWKSELTLHPEHSGDCIKEPITCMRCLVENYYSEADQILAYLDSQGLAIKVKRELPDSILSPKTLEEEANKFPDYGGGDWEQNVARVQRLHTEKIIKKAGWSAFGPLIDKGADDAKGEGNES